MGSFMVHSEKSSEDLELFYGLDCPLQGGGSGQAVQFLLIKKAFSFHTK